MKSSDFDLLSSDETWGRIKMAFVEDQDGKEGSGSIMFIEYPHVKHEAPIFQFNDELTIVLLGAGGRPAVRALYSMGAADMNIAGGKRQPDASWKPAAVAAGLPTVVLEVASSQTLQYVQATAQAYLAAGVRLVVIIKLHPLVVHPGGVGNARPLLCELWQNGAPAQPVFTAQFGDVLQGGGVPNPLCAAAAMPVFELQLPAAEVFHGAAVPAGVGANIIIDLFEIKGAITAAADYLQHP
jgi:hypothetical protein